MPDSSAYLKPEVLAQITRLGLRAQHVVEGSISGLHRSPLHGVSVEFADHREYAPGDDLKRLDWRAYARSNRYFIKRYEEESNLRCTILLDASASMRYGGNAARLGAHLAPPLAAGLPARRDNPRQAAALNGRDRSAAPWSKWDCAATIACSIATMLIRQRDAVGLAVFDEEERVFLRAAATASQMAKLVDAIEKTTPQRQTDLASVMSKVADQIRGRGLVIVVSDLLTDLDAFYEGLGRLQYQGHEIIIIQVLDADEIELPFNDSVLFKDIEGTEEVFAEPWAFRKAYKHAMEKFIGEVGKRCRFGGIDHLLIQTDEDLGKAMSFYLHQRQRFAGLKRGGRMTSGESVVTTPTAPTGATATPSTQPGTGE